jgi:hypothetical protein
MYVRENNFGSKMYPEPWSGVPFRKKREAILLPKSSTKIITSIIFCRIIMNKTTFVSSKILCNSTKPNVPKSGIYETVLKEKMYVGWRSIYN